MPGPRAVQNLQMPHPGTDKARRQMPHSSRGGGGAWCRWNWLMHYDINNSATDNYSHVSNFERKIDSKWLNEKKKRSKCFTFTHICPSFANISASKYRTSKGTLHQNYTSKHVKHQNHFSKVNMRSFAIISNVKCQSTIQTWMFTSENAIEVVECSLVNL